jgi:dipeptidyl aminopeptidase/acylaminoacyl peptidase
MNDLAIQTINARIENKTAELCKRSPLFWLDELPDKLPILLLQGAKDKRVSAVSSEKMQQLQRPYRLVIYEHGGHALNEHGKEARQEVLRWFTKYL